MAKVNFDPVARLYRWMEYFSFGPLLVRCRNAQLSQLRGSRHALVLGDGDGRFLARLLQHNPTLQADVVDSSRAMLRQLQQRLRPLDATARICLHHADALAWTPPGRYDLIVTHFFLDCFFPGEVEQLLDRMLPHTLPGAQWVLSEFAIPRHPLGALAWRAASSACFIVPSPCSPACACVDCPTMRLPWLAAAGCLAGNAIIWAGSCVHRSGVCLRTFSS